MFKNPKFKLYQIVPNQAQMTKSKKVYNFKAFDI